MVDMAYDHRDHDGKHITVCHPCLVAEVSDIVHEKHKQAGNIKKYNAARRAESKIRKYYEQDPEKAKPLP
jgi:hypothetical protein